MTKTRLAIMANVEQENFEELLQWMRSFDAAHPDVVDFQIVAGDARFSVDEALSMVGRLNPPLALTRAARHWTAAADGDAADQARELGERTAAASPDIADWLLRLSSFVAEIDALDLPVSVKVSLAAGREWPKEDLPLAVFRNQEAERRRL